MAQQNLRRISQYRRFLSSSPRVRLAHPDDVGQGDKSRTVKLTGAAAFVRKRSR